MNYKVITFNLINFTENQCLFEYFRFKIKFYLNQFCSGAKCFWIIEQTVANSRSWDQNEKQIQNKMNKIFRTENLWD